MELQETRENGFSLVEMLVGIVLAIMIVFGARALLLRSQQGNAKDGLRKNYADISQDLTRRMNHFYKRQNAKTVGSPEKLSMTLPSGPVLVETICVKNTVDYQAPDTLLNRCVKCGNGERQVVRIQSGGKTQIFPSAIQRPDMPAAASVCFKIGTDPDDVELIVEILVVDPVNKTDRKVNKFESLLVKDVGNINSFE